MLEITALKTRRNALGKSTECQDGFARPLQGALQDLKPVRGSGHQQGGNRGRDPEELLQSLPQSASRPGS